jgi:hypothetical protein
MQKEGVGDSACARTHVLIYAKKGRGWQCLITNTRINVQKEGAGDGACAKTHVLMCRKRERVPAFSNPVTVCAKALMCTKRERVTVSACSKTHVLIYAQRGSG